MAGYFDYNWDMFNYSSYDLGYPSFAWNSYSIYNDYSYSPSLFWDMPSYSFGWDTWTPTSYYSYANDYSFDKPYKTIFSLDESKPKTSSSNYSYRTVTPGRIGRTKRPSFKTTEAAQLYDPFMNKARNFNPKTDLGPEFLAKVKKVAKKIDCDYKDLLAVMQAESGLNPYIPNQAGYGAYGLIQFQPATLRGLGSSPEKLLAMSPVEQLDLVEKHFLKAKKSAGLKGHLNSGQVYGLVLAPGYVNNSYFYKAGSSGYSANKGIDTKYGNNDGKITQSDLTAYMNAKRVNENIFAA